MAAFAPLTATDSTSVGMLLTVTVPPAESVTLIITLSTPDSATPPEVSPVPIAPAVVRFNVARSATRVETVSVSVPRPPVIAALAPVTFAPELAEIASSFAVVLTELVAFEAVVLTTGPAKSTTVLPVPCEPSCMSAAVRAVTPVSVTTVSVDTATPGVPAPATT